MFDFLRKLFRTTPRIEQLARGRDRESLVRELGAADIFVFAAMDEEGFDPAKISNEQLIAEIERAARDLSQHKDGFAPFFYEHGGRRRLPFFTSDQHAQTFAGAFSQERNRIYPFQMLGVQGTVLLRLFAAADEVVMNDKTAAETTLSPEDIAIAQRIWR